MGISTSYITVPWQLLCRHAATYLISAIDGSVIQQEGSLIIILSAELGSNCLQGGWMCMIAFREGGCAQFLARRVDVQCCLQGGWMCRVACREGGCAQLLVGRVDVHSCL